MKAVRILIVDDHDIVLRGLRPLIESVEGWEVCGEALDGRRAVELSAQLHPDIVVLDVALPVLDGVAATQQIRLECPETEVLAFTGTESESMVHRLFAAGARACVIKSEAGEQLLPAIQALSLHQPFLASRTTQMVFDRYLHGGLRPGSDGPTELTPRELETVKLLAEGRSNKEVAAACSISVKTVESHRAAIMRKLELTAFSELVRYAVRHRLVEA